MSSPKDVVHNQLQMGQMLIEKLTAELSDAEYFRPPCTAGNHVGWCVGHIACTEDWSSSLVSGREPRFPKAVHELLNGESTCAADAGQYPPRKELDEMFLSARAHLLEQLKGFNVNRWDDPSPDGASKDYFPTLGSIWTLQGAHQFWHIGQITTCRSAMGKTRIFSGN